MAAFELASKIILLSEIVLVEGRDRDIELSIPDKFVSFVFSHSRTKAYIFIHSSK